MPIFVGLDCGGSSSRVLAMDADSNILYRGQGGSANLASTPERTLASNLRKATDGCPPPTSVCGCFAGLLTPLDKNRAETHLHHLFPDSDVRAEPDYAAALFASSEQPDICIICGTGSLICSTYEGKLVKTGGGGYMLGDYGSAYQFGRDALSEFLFGDGPTSEAMLALLEETFQTADPTEIVAKVYKTASPPALVARFAKVIGHDALAGQPYALASLNSNMSKLADLTARHAHYYRASARSLSISLAGGIWKSTGPFKQAFHDLLVKKLERTELILSTIQNPPVLGAVKLAMEKTIGN